MFYIDHKPQEQLTKSILDKTPTLLLSKQINQAVMISLELGESCPRLIPDLKNTLATIPHHIPRSEFHTHLLFRSVLNKTKIFPQICSQEKILAPVRTHTQITPQVRRIEPELQVNRYAVDVPVPNPVPVEREVIYQTHVAKPYTVEVEQPYPVAQPYEVRPVHQVVDTPIIDQYHHTVHQPIATAVQYAVAAPAVAYAEAAPALAYGAYAAAPVAVEAAPVAIEAAPVAVEAVAVV